MGPSLSQPSFVFQSCPPVASKRAVSAVRSVSGESVGVVAVGVAGAVTERAEAPGVEVAVSLVGETDSESLPVLQAARETRSIRARVPNTRRCRIVVCALRISSLHPFSQSSTCAMYCLRLYHKDVKTGKLLPASRSTTRFITRFPTTRRVFRHVSPSLSACIAAGCLVD